MVDQAVHSIVARECLHFNRRWWREGGYEIPTSTDYTLFDSLIAFSVVRSKSTRQLDPKRTRFKWNGVLLKIGTWVRKALTRSAA